MKDQIISILNRLVGGIIGGIFFAAVANGICSEWQCGFDRHTALWVSAIAGADVSIFAMALMQQCWQRPESYRACLLYGTLSSSALWIIFTWVLQSVIRNHGFSWHALVSAGAAGAVIGTFMWLSHVSLLYGRLQLSQKQDQK